MCPLSDKSQAGQFIMGATNNMATTRGERKFSVCLTVNTISDMFRLQGRCTFSAH